VVPILATAAAAAALLWLTHDVISIPRQLPGADGRPAGAGASLANVFPGLLTAGDGKPSGIEGAWPRFRGSDLDAVCKDKTPLLRQWPAGGPKQLWSVPMGQGYAGAAIANGRVYVLDYDQKKKGDALRCLSLDDGREIWRRFYGVRIPPQHGISRTVPTIASNYVLTLGPLCHVMCCDAATGEFKWGIDAVKDYGTTVPKWYAGQCPLIDHDKAIIATGGKTLLVAVDLPTGKVAWESENPRNWQMTHSSVVPMDLDGEEMYVYCASGGIVGASAATGKILWQYDQWQDSFANVPTPIVLGGGRFFVCVSSGHGPKVPGTGKARLGAMVLQVARQGADYMVKPILAVPDSTLASEQQTPVFYQGNIFAVRGPRADGELICMDLSGKTLWTSGEDKFGLGPYMIAGGAILAMDDSGVLSMIDASSGGYKRLAQAQVAGFDLQNKGEAVESWAPMAMADGRLIVRDLTRMYCLDLRGK
jgi:outer membrane protein assembly factor BamB